MDLQVLTPLAISTQLQEMEFHQLANFNDGHTGVFWSEAGGPSPWEMHPDCDELLQVLEGSIEVEVLPAEGGPGLKVLVPVGAFLVVPRGCWHRQTMISKTTELYLTPGQTLHSGEDDPR